MGVETLLSQVFNGLSLSSVLLLVGLGLSITFGIMGVINFAHGEFLMVGAYVVYVLQMLFNKFYGSGSTRVSFLISIPLSFFVAALLGSCLKKS